MKSIIIISCFILIGYNLGYISCNHIPSEDRNESDGVELIREKRGDSFLDRIMKSIPFLHMSSPPNILEEEPIDRMMEEDDNDDDDDDDDDDDKLMTSEYTLPTKTPSSATVGLSDVPTSVLTKASTTMSSTATVLSATSAQTATPFSSNRSTHIVSMSEKIDSISSTVSTVSSVSTNEMIKTTPAQTSTIIMVTPSVADSKSITPDSFMSSPITSPTASDALLNVTSLFTYPLTASHVSPMQISSTGSLPSTLSKMAATPVMEKSDEEPVIKMMIMSGENPMRVQEYGGRLADERGYGDTLVKEQIGDDVEAKDEDVDSKLSALSDRIIVGMATKNIRFMYSGVLVPVMSGLAGALMITFGILTYKCLKRKKLKRVRYYGGKPSSGLYRLDQVGLLSDFSSDEE